MRHRVRVWFGNFDLELIRIVLLVRRHFNARLLIFLLFIVLRANISSCLLVAIDAALFCLWLSLSVLDHFFVSEGFLAALLFALTVPLVLVVHVLVGLGVGDRALLLDRVL